MFNRSDRTWSLTFVHHFILWKSLRSDDRGTQTGHAREKLTWASCGSWNQLAQAGDSPTSHADEWRNWAPQSETSCDPAQLVASRSPLQVCSQTSCGRHPHRPSVFFKRLVAAVAICVYNCCLWSIWRHRLAAELVTKSLHRECLQSATWNLYQACSRPILYRRNN